MPNEESRLKRDDPLTTIIAHTASVEVSLWGLCNGQYFLSAGEMVAHS